ncbi:alginate export family protein [Flavobacterium psychroterrae]|uniref:Alginate export family protein n=1 Tax=Flavobacterium psychroterrae TaxID=2133767 RepID=A0ABS5PC04_9FLAO|nr:alginate export family protein [Flavobacterium psychroterrae]MBS7231365.1 alginate export family protein [Flavobacterium psychroterrae]
MKNLKIILVLLVIGLGFDIQAQELDVNLQIRPRFEYRNGYKSLLPEGQEGTSQISQRSRLNFNYKQDELTVKLTLQNTRTWGDVATTALNDKNGVAVFEAWAQYNLTEKWSARMGRQVLSYDNQRIMGEMDWAQQGQSHDALMVSFHPKNHQLDMGIAYNSTAENNVQTQYTVNSYKAMQYAWYHTTVSDLGISFLVLNTGYEYANPDAKLLVDYKQTFGTYLTYKTKKIDTNLSLYGQTGKSNDLQVSAYNAAINFGYNITDSFKAGLGYEFLSGKDTNDGSKVIKSFNPIFGTNHAFNGYMDYFYVGNHLNNVGLQDAFLKLNYNVNKWQFALIPHVFLAAADVVTPLNEKLDSYLGTEIDATFGYTFKKEIVVTGGYSQMFGSKTMEFIKTGDAGHTNNWAWLMISVNPRIFNWKK